MVSRCDLPLCPPAAVGQCGFGLALPWPFTAVSRGRLSRCCKGSGQVFTEMRSAQDASSQPAQRHSSGFSYIQLHVLHGGAV